MSLGRLRRRHFVPCAEIPQAMRVVRWLTRVMLIGAPTGQLPKCQYLLMLRWARHSLRPPHYSTRRAHLKSRQLIASPRTHTDVPDDQPHLTRAPSAPAALRQQRSTAGRGHWLVQSTAGGLHPAWPRRAAQALESLVHHHSAVDALADSRRSRLPGLRRRLLSRSGIRSGRRPCPVPPLRSGLPAARSAAGKPRLQPFSPAATHR